MHKLRMHPDFGGDEWNASLINIARDVLLDPRLRAEYDQQLIDSGQIPGGRPATRADKAHNKSTAGGRPNWHRQNEDAANHSEAPETTQHPVTNLLQFDPGQMCPFCNYPVKNQKQQNSTGYDSSDCCLRCNAPLQKVDAYKAVMEEDLRNIHRSAVELSVQVWDSWPYKRSWDALVSDWSTEGCCIQMRHSMDVGSVILLQSSQFNAIALVRYCSDDITETNFIGLQFITLEASMEPGAFVSSSA